MQMSKKVSSLAEMVKDQTGIDYDIHLSEIFFTPENAIPEISNGTVYLFGKRVFIYRRLRRIWNSVYGITFGKRYFAIHFGKLVLHIHIWGLHRNSMHQVKYQISGNPNRFSKKEITQFLMEKLNGR